MLKPDGLFAAWCDGKPRIAEPAVERVVHTFYRDTLDPYWPAERHHVETGYRELSFPLRRRTVPDFALTADWTDPQLLAYVQSWSATPEIQVVKAQLFFTSRKRSSP